MQTITAEQLKDMLDAGEPFKLINVLPEHTFRQEHIPGSINLPVEDENFLHRVQERIGADKGYPIVVYCASTECDASPKAGQILDEAGFTNIMDFEAGTAGWKDAGYPIETGAAQTA